MTVSAARYLALNGSRPVCRKNGCNRFTAAASGDMVGGVDGMSYRRKRNPTETPNGSLAQGAITQRLTTGCETGVAVDKSSKV